MSTYKTEYEAWQAVLDLLEGYGMPPLWEDSPDGDVCPGLCYVLTRMFTAGSISGELLSKMEKRIGAADAKWTNGFLAPMYEVRPRIRYVRKFMEDCK